MAGSFSIFRAGERGVWNEHGTGCDTQDLSARLSMTFHLLLLLISSTRQLNIPPLEHVASADWHLPRVVVFDYFRCPAIRCSARQGEITRRSNDAHAENSEYLDTPVQISHRYYISEPLMWHIVVKASEATSLCFFVSSYNRKYMSPAGSQTSRPIENRHIT